MAKGVQKGGSPRIVTLLRFQASYPHRRSLRAYLSAILFLLRRISSRCRRAKRSGENGYPNDDNDVRHVEHSRVKWPGTDDHKIGNQTVLGKAIDELRGTRLAAW